MAPRIKVVVKKVPHPEPFPDYRIAFPVMNDLYLQFLENPKKIRPELRGVVPEPSFSMPTGNMDDEGDMYYDEPHDSDDHEMTLEEALGEDDDQVYYDEYDEDDEFGGETTDYPEDDEDDEPEDRGLFSELTSTLTGAISGAAASKPQPSSSQPRPQQPIPQPTAPPMDPQLEKRDLIHKFQLLREGYDGAVSIPEYNMYSDLAKMKEEYNYWHRQLEIKASVSDYESYLALSFIVMELSLTWIGIPASGLTLHQFKVRHKYHRLLLELGDKWYSPIESQWPVEYRLMFVACVQTTIFVVGNIISQRGGPMANSFFNMVMGQHGGGGGFPQPQQNVASAYQEEPRMRGPRMRGPRARASPPPSEPKTSPKTSHRSASPSPPPPYDDDSSGSEIATAPRRRRRAKLE